MKKIIAFDVDDCICQTRGFDEIACRNYMKNHGIKFDDNLDFKTSYCMPKLYGLSPELEEDFAIKTKQYIMKNIAMMPEYFAVEVIHKLREKGFEICMISSRAYKFWNGDPKTHLKNWLDKYGIEYDGIYVGFEDKAATCKQVDCEFMVEDNPNFVSILNSQNIKTVLIKTQYNKDYNHKLNHTVNNLLELYEFLGETYNFDSTDILNLY